MITVLGAVRQSAWGFRSNSYRVCDYCSFLLKVAKETNELQRFVSRDTFVLVSMRELVRAVVSLDYKYFRV